MISKIILEIVKAQQAGKLNLAGEYLTDLRNNNFFLANFRRASCTDAFARMIRGGVIERVKGGWQYNGDIFNNVEVLNDTFSNAYLCDIARTSFYANETPASSEERDARMLAALVTARHDSVFEFAELTLRVNIPIYIARQIMRYRCASYLEASRRRIAPKKRRNARNDIDKFYNAAVDKYRELIKKGYKKEDARAVLPVSDITTLVIKWNYRALMHIFDERLTVATQPATRSFVMQVYNIVKLLHPDFIKFYEESRKKRD